MATACQIPGVAVVVRDSDLRLRWANEVASDAYGVPLARLLGSLPSVVMDERAEAGLRALYAVAAAGRGPRRYVGVWQGKRCVMVIYPLDAASFGHGGMLSLIAPDMAEVRTEAPLCPVCMLGPRLGLLTKGELCVMYLFAQGRAPAQIGERLFRSTHTVNEHFKAIRRKLGTVRQAELAAMMACSGVAQFTEAEWCSLTGVHIPNPSASLPATVVFGARAGDRAGV